MKLVSCIRGEVWDVAVDVRAGSPTFLKWHAERHSEDNQHALLIPEGFAHGFQAITDFGAALEQAGEDADLGRARRTVRELSAYLESVEPAA